MKKIALIQFRMRPEMVAAEQKEYQIAMSDMALIKPISALDTSLSWTDPASLVCSFDAVILGGSGEFDLNGGRDETDPARHNARLLQDRVKHLVDYLIMKDKPTLGVCFGHQIIGDLRNGNVTNDISQKKIGSHEVTFTSTASQDQLFGTLPQNFIAQHGHKDSLTSLPEGSVLLAESDNCRFSALRYGSNVYKVQFHPELTASDVRWRLQNSPGYLPEGVSIDSLVVESPEASSIIAKFMNLLR